MLYLLSFLRDEHIIFNLFRYVTFRAAGASVTAFLISIIAGPMLIQWLKNLKAVAFHKRESAEKIHGFFEMKTGVPTMGGVLIVLSVISSIVLWADLRQPFVLALLGIILWFGLVGFLDDMLKLHSGTSKGLSGMTKMAGQLLAGAALGIWLYADKSFEPWLHLPFIKSGVIYLGILFIPFVILVLVGSSNALNLTDGLDGLAIGCTLFTSGAFAIMSYVVGRVDFAQYLSVPYVPSGGEIAIVCAALVGASAGFLWYNSYPAEVMMGDTGSLSLGGALGAIAVLLKKEAVLVIVGGIFVLEAVSVILQVFSFKVFKKRIFLMSPFHHHLQLKGWPESKVTIRLWIVALILAVVGLSTLKLR